jgi:LCP family protein required for cell wall assembly
MVLKIRTWFLQLNTAKKALLISVLVLLIAGTGSVCYLARLRNPEIMFPEIKPEDDNPDVQDVSEAFGKDILNILLLGFDRNSEREAEGRDMRPDTIMIAAINLQTGKVDVVSIPRDTLVPIYNSGGWKDKINSAYTAGWEAAVPSEDDDDDGILLTKHRRGLEYQVKTVSMALKGIPIHYYVSVDMDGVLEVVDIMGGVWYDVKAPVKHKSGRIIAEPGYQLLKGKKLMDFLRSRQYANGDIQRVKTQQAVLLAAFSQLKQAGRLMQAPKIYAAMRDIVETNLSFEQILSLAWFANRNTAPDEISTHVLQTSYAEGRLLESWENSYSYLILNQKARVKLIYEVWGKKVDPDPTDVIFPKLPDEDPNFGWDDANRSPSEPEEQPPANSENDSTDPISEDNPDPTPEPGGGEDSLQPEPGTDD